MCDQHLYKSPTIEVYGHCRLLLPRLRVNCLFFCNLRLKNCRHGQLWIEPTTLDLSSQPWLPHYLSIFIDNCECIQFVTQKEHIQVYNACQYIPPSLALTVEKLLA